HTRSRDTGRIYGLSFHSSSTAGGKTIPEILVTVSFARIANLEMRERLRQLGKEDPLFTKCGSYHEEKETGHYRFTLSARHLETSAEVMGVLVRMLQTPLFEKYQREEPADSLQLLSVLVAPQWLGGYIYPTLRHWLTRTGMEADKKRVAHQYAGMLPVEIETAMQLTWRTIASKELKRYRTDCRASIREDGRFLLGCYGNACDVAIYPDGDDGATADYVLSEYACHNLDFAAQQLTLFTGIAALHTVADRELQSS
ncbi:MAG TPA: hypothetical protein VM103_02820, partial [Candidatus Paceibacterota bacterium]|nr:hypothetical protein [Candidatus Paceibacterota bacterium]